jgi:hypothetical protein
MTTRRDEANRRAWWWHRQGLDGSLEGASPAAVLERSGWARSVGGASPYLTFFSRAGLSRTAVDAAVAALGVHELPAARGCTYVVPVSHYRLALLAGRGFDDEQAIARKLGVTDEEIGRLCEAIVRALKGGPLEPAAIKQAVGGACRDLGEAGAKKGLGSTLPVGLARLQAGGAIRRVPTNGRLDQQRYRYAAWSPSPLQGSLASPEDVHVDLARQFFSWIGPARLADFQKFAGLGVKQAKIAVTALRLTAVDADGEWLMHGPDAEAFAHFRLPTTPQYALVGSLDALVLLRRDIAALLDLGDTDRRVPVGKGAAPALGGLSDLPSHGILDRGRLVGLWEYDTDTQSIAWWAFGAKDKALDAAVARTEAYVREELGDARSFSLDSPTSRAPRIAALRKTAGGR